MEANLYYYFYTVCKNKSFSKAGKILCVTQPAVSYAIQKLEEYLNLELFDRTEKKFSLTKSGEELYSRIKIHFEQLIQVERYIMNLKTESLGEITLGAPSHLATILLTDKIIKFIEQNPSIKISLVSGSSDLLISQLTNNEIDVLIDSEPIDFDKIEEFERSLIGEENFVFFVNKEVKLDYISYKNIDKYNLVFPGETTNCVKRLITALKEVGIDYCPKLCVGTTEVVKKIVENSDMIGFAMKKDVNLSKFKVVKTDIILPSYKIYKIWSSQVNENVKNFINIIQTM